MSERGILGHLANPEKGIRENLEDKYFEFYVAGITQNHDGQSLQHYHVQKVPRQK